MRLFIDENVSPTLSGVGHGRGYDSTSVRDRGKRGSGDYRLTELAFDEDRVIVTNNDRDFFRLTHQRQYHSGMVLIDEGTRAQEQDWLEAAIDYIEAQAAGQDQAPEVFMTNRVVEVDTYGNCTDYDWPAET